MKLKIFYSIVPSIIIATILTLFAAFIYFHIKQVIRNELLSKNKKEAAARANLVLTQKFETETIKQIFLNQDQINQFYIAIFDTNFKVIYQNIEGVVLSKEFKRFLNEFQIIGDYDICRGDTLISVMKFSNNNKSYIIIAYIKNNLVEFLYKDFVRYIVIAQLFIVFIILLLNLYLSSRYFGFIEKITNELSKISTSELSFQIKYENKKNELSKFIGAINNLLERLNKSLEAKNQFISNVVHELRTPLSAIVTELELTSLKDRSVEEYKTILINIHKDAKKLVRIISNLLDFSKASYDKSSINFKPVRLDEILLDAKLQVQKSNEEFKIDIYFENEFEDEASITILGNEYFLKTAFVNLIENGCKYSFNKNTIVKILTKENGVEIKFIDNGIGISAEDLPFIFEPFYRGKNNTLIDGTGIGLSLVKKIVQLHGGSITVNSIKNKETIFSVSFPTLTNLAEGYH